MHAVPWSFVLKDDRSYVHGSTLVEAALLAAREHEEAPRGAIKCDATFVRLVQHDGRFWVTADQAALPPRDRTSALFRFYDASRSIWLAFEPSAGEPVTRRIRSSVIVQDFRLTGPFAGTCRVDVSSTDSLLSNILEANKRVHLETLAAETTPAVRNAYMRGVPVMAAGSGELADLAIEHVSEKTIGGLAATLNRLTCAALSSEPFEMAYTYSVSDAK